jgi:hypothetical protein
MEYLKGTKSELEAYNDEVVAGENYIGATIKWSEIIKVENEFYIAFNEKYPSELEKVTELIIPFLGD